MNRPDFQVTTDETGAINVAPGSLVAFNSGGTEIFTIGDKTLNSPFSLPFKTGSGTWVTVPQISNPYLPSGSYFKTPDDTFWQGPTFEDANALVTWRLDYDGTTLTITETQTNGLLYDGAFALPILSRNYGTSTLDEQEYAYDSTTGGVDLYLGVTDPTLKIEIDTATLIAELSDATDVIASRTGDLATPEIIGQYVPTAYGNTTYGAGLEMVIVDYDYAPQTLAADIDAQTNYNGGNPFDFTIQYFGGSLFSPWRYLIELLPNITGEPDGTSWPDNSTATIETGIMVPIAVNLWKLASGQTWELESGGLDDGVDFVGTQVAGLEDGLGGVMEATAYGESTYNGGDPFRFLISRIPSVQNPGWVYATITIDGADDATAFNGPFFAGTMPANTATEIHVPIAKIDLSGNVTTYQQGTINWRP